MINVCIIDDHDIVREGIKKVLSCTQDIRIIHEESAPNTLINKSLPKDIDIVILDLSFGDGYCELSSIDLVKNKFPEANILVFSMMDESIFGVEVLRYGVKGFVSKQSGADSLISAIRTVSEGSLYVSSATSAALADRYVRPNQRKLDQLSQREVEVLILFGSGFSVKETSEKLFLSIKTISTYKRRILDKLELQNTAELVKYCIQNQLIQS